MDRDSLEISLWGFNVKAIGFKAMIILAILILGLAFLTAPRMIDLIEAMK